MKVLKIKEYKNGAAKIDVEISQTEKEMLKSFYNKKRFHTNLIRRAVVEGVEIMASKNKIEGGK